MKNDALIKRSVATLVFLFIAVFTMASHQNMGRQIVRIEDRKTVSFREMVEEVSIAGVIYIGERHDSRAHHRTQLDVIRALHEKDGDLAIGLEMFKKEDQQSLDAWVSGDMTEDRFIPVFLENWGFGWELYRDIFFYAREHGIPLIGLNVPWAITKKVAESGFLSLTDEEQNKLPPGVTCELDRQYMDHLMRIFMHKRSNDRSFYYFCEAQVLWDQAMAWYLAEYMKGNPEKTVVVLTGSIHAWKYGVPKHSRRYISAEQRVIVPDLPVGPEMINEDDADYFVIHS